MAQPHITMAGAWSSTPNQAPIPTCMVTNPILLANSDRGRSHKPSIHSPLHLGEVGLTRTRLSVTTCTLVSRYAHLYTHATSCQSYVQGDNHLHLPDTTIHGVTEQTRPDMQWLHFRCWLMLHVQNQSVSKFLCGVNGCRSTPDHRMSGSWCPMRRKIYTFGRRPATIPICAAALTLLFRCLILSTPREKRWSLTITLSCPYLPRSGGVWLYQNVRKRRGW